jgi:hypothetical protein
MAVVQADIMETINQLHILSTLKLLHLIRLLTRHRQCLKVVVVYSCFVCCYERVNIYGDMLEDFVHCKL